MKLIRPFLLFGLISIVSAGAVFAQAVGSVAGTVTDLNGAVVVGATVTAVSATDARKQSISNAKGEYSIAGLLPGKYTIKAFATNFELYENTEVDVTAGEKNELFILLSVGGIVENVDVSQNDQISTDVDNNADANVIKGADLEALPDDPDELQAYLQALVGASAGPNGGQIYIDGFTGGQLPSKDQIREIRINSNPFSAEYDRVGSGRIEILTRPGSDKFRGSLNGSFNDESLNSRNPFALNRAPSQQRNFGGNYSGPIKKGKSSFSLDFSHRSNDNNSIINALILDPSLNIVSFRRDVQVPTTSIRFNPRIDFAINSKNTAVLRYSFDRNVRENQGLNETSLLSRAYDTTSRGHEIRLTETMIINSRTVNETRFEFSNDKRDQNGDNSIPTINVSNAFTGGGASIGMSFNKNRVLELNNFTSTSFGKTMQHSFKVGGRLRNINITDRSENNYAGTFSFPGFFLPTGSINACDLNGDSIVSSIEQYRCKVSGATGTNLNPTQFTLATGNPELGVTRTDGGLFVSDDWKMRPDLLLSLGLRYENQTNISSNYNFAPRLGIAWSPGAGGAKPAKFVFRGGFGVFYDRFSENLTLNAERNNGINQLSLLVSANDTDPVRRAAAIQLLSQPIFTATGVTNTLTAAQILAALPQSANTIRAVSPTLQSPYSMQGIFSIERAINRMFTLSTTFSASRSLHQLRTRNVNAPVCVLITDCVGALRPDPNFGNINTYESSGTTNQLRLTTNLRANISRKVSFFAFYTLGSLKSDADGTGSAPAYSYDLRDEYGRSSADSRHSFFLAGNLSLPWSISVSPHLNISSGSPFNITRGIDANGDGFFTERPTFAQLATRCAEKGLTASYCNVSGFEPNAILPRNFGEGPSSVSFNSRFSRNFGFGKSATARAVAGGTGGDGAGPGGGGGGGGRGGFGGGGGGGGRGGFGGFGGEGRKPYNLNISVNVNNILNLVNFSNPLGSLSSSRFGESLSTGGGSFGRFGGGGGGSGANRRIDLSARFSW